MKTPLATTLCVAIAILSADAAPTNVVAQAKETVSAVNAATAANENLLAVVAAESPDTATESPAADATTADAPAKEEAQNEKAPPAAKTTDAPAKEVAQVADAPEAPVAEKVNDAKQETGDVQGQATQPETAFDEIDLEDDSALAAKKTRVTGDLTEGTASLVDIECDEATLADIIRQFRKTTGANILNDDSTNLQRRVSVTLRKVPWLEGMSAILGSRGFRIEERDNIYRVVEDVRLVPVSTRTFALNHASAKELANLFNENYGHKDNAGRIVGPIATSFEGANVVVVTATDKILADCDAIVKAVDKAVAQIYIEARFLELSSAAMHKLGVQWDQLESWGATAKGFKGGVEVNNGRIANYGVRSQTGSTSLSASGSRENGNSFNGTTTSTGNNGAWSSTTDSTLTRNEARTSKSSGEFTRGSMLSSLAPAGIQDAASAGITAASMGWRNAYGFSGQFSADDFRLALSAFEELGEGKIFSNPKVIVSNGKKAEVDMTTKFPNVELQSNRDTSTTTPFMNMSARIQEIPGDKETGLFAGSIFYSWGITLSVTPRISPDGLISVEIVPSISQLDTSVSPTGFYQVQSAISDETPYGLFPIIEMKRIATEFTMKDGSTAVIGGLSKTVEDDVDSGIPYLRKLPWIGPKLFGWKSRQKVQKEIIVCVTIGIANPAELPHDIGLPKNAILGREYVTGKRLEPGDRKESAAAVLQIDLDALDKRKPKNDEAPAAPAPAPVGKVVITPAAP